MTPSALPPSLLTDALQACVVGVVITDATKGDHPVVYANPAFERLTGYSQDEILGRNCRFLQGQDKQQLALDQVRQALHQGRVSRLPCATTARTASSSTTNSR
ncbi:PAS domain-containing protein [Deinococcus malanensis]|uniref:PAS domain-containing protein n=1 Tax=Deinococcus malanensis TaxID=1706855 RepID=UPI00362B29AB